MECGGKRDAALAGAVRMQSGDSGSVLRLPPRSIVSVAASEKK